MYSTPEAEHEFIMSKAESRITKHKQLQKDIKEETVVALDTEVFLRGNKRKPKETFGAYRRGLRNAKKALKARLKYGPGTKIYINRLTMEII